MPATELKYGIPNIELMRSSGGTVNPSCFAGHQLVVHFLPTDSRRSSELESYRKLSEELADTDAWFLLVADKNAVSDNTSTPVALDPDGKVWRAFKDVAGEASLDRSEGATFFFTRGGAFHRVWQGAGHANAVVQELRSRI